MAHMAKASRPRLRSVLLRWAPILAAFALIVAAEARVYTFIKARGVSVTGDEPHYLIPAKAFTQLSVHPLRAYLADLQAHHLYQWPPGTPATNLVLQLFAGPHGPVSTHSLGLSALLAPFIFGGERLARLGLMGIETAGFIYFYLRAANLAGLSRQAKVVFAIVIASPAIWLAGTQIYPDLLTGILMACSLVDLLAVESRRHLDRWGTGVAAVSLGLLPWLHQQNLVPAALILIAFALVARRAQLWAPLVVVAGVSVASWLLLLAYNLYDYGHPFGPPQPFPSLNGAGFTEILGLLFDRHQGLFVQVPLAALGLIGLWLARRLAPVAVIATVASAASLLYLNGTFYHAPYGGTSFAGRFQWASLLPLLAWCPYVIAALGRSRARVWGLGAVAALLWVLEAIPIARGDHSYYNQLAVSAPWDPSTYPGWWGGVDRLLPEFVPGSRLLGWPWFGLPMVLVLLCLVVVVTSTITCVDRRGIVRLGAVSVAAAVVTGVLAVVAPLPLPTGPLSFRDQDVGGPLQSEVLPATGPAVGLQGIGAGTFRLTVDYALQGDPGSAKLLSYCTHGAAKGPTQSSASTGATLAPGARRTVMTLRCPAGTIWFQMAVQPATSLAVGKLVLAKMAN
jgi:hypothetical protein